MHPSSSRSSSAAKARLLAFVSAVVLALASAACGGGGSHAGTGGAGGGGFGGMRAVRAQVDSLPEARRAEYAAREEEITRKFAPPAATVRDFVEHIDYAVKLIGIDHVGISSDFDGGGGVEGWNGADETFNVTLELVRRGYTEEQIAKIWSGNLLRVMDEVQAKAEKK